MRRSIAVDAYDVGVRIVVAFAVCCVVFLVVSASATASQLIARDATRVSLAVNTNAQALVRKAGVTHHVLAWGATNALPPTQGRASIQVHSRLLRRLVEPAAACLEGFRERLRAIRRAVATLARHGLPGPRRHLLGAAALVAQPA